jgi:hypothetical protein
VTQDSHNQPVGVIIEAKLTGDVLYIYYRGAGVRAVRAADVDAELASNEVVRDLLCARAEAELIDEPVPVGDLSMFEVHSEYMPLNLYKDKDDA